jgi:hypothetical protein
VIEASGDRRLEQPALGCVKILQRGVGRLRYGAGDAPQVDGAGRLVDLDAGSAAFEPETVKV